MIQAIIQQHTNKITSGKIPRPQGCCPRCFSQPKTFKLHECRKRSFRYSAGSFVRIIMTLLARWKCVECGKTFTAYPPFACPHKRYALDDILRLSSKYNGYSYSATVDAFKRAEAFLDIYVKGKSN